MSRKFDIVLLGATGFTGKLCTEYMTRNLPSHVRWAIAGRSQAKLEGVSKEFDVPGAGGSIVSLNLNSDEEIVNLAKSTRVLINVIGPYVTNHGSSVFKACAENGTHYADCAGEPAWRQEMIEQHEKAAQASGAKLITTCGWACAPADLTTYLAVAHIRRTFNAPTLEAIGCMYDVRGSFSGGSVSSGCAQNETYSAARTASASAPFAISPVSPSPAQQQLGNYVLPQLNQVCVQKVDGLGTLTATVDKGNEESVVGRSWGLQQAAQSDSQPGYGPNFRFSSRMRLPNAFIAFVARIAFVAIAAILSHPLGRTVMKKLVPAGSGPDAKARRKNHFTYRVLAVADAADAASKRVTVDFAYAGDPYFFTGVALTEAALVLLEDETVGSGRGGIYTPSMLGQKYAERLQRPGADVKITSRVLE